MHIDDREDIAESRRLEAYKAFDQFSFNELMSAIIGFASEVLLSEQVVATLNFPTELVGILHKYAKDAISSLSNRLDSDMLVADRVAAWGRHDLTSRVEDKSLIRYCICFLYSEEDAEFEQFGAGAVFEVVYSVLLDIGPGFGKLFTDFCISKN